MHISLGSTCRVDPCYAFVVPQVLTCSQCARCGGPSAGTRSRRLAWSGGGTGNLIIVHYRVDTLTCCTILSPDSHYLRDRVGGSGGTIDIAVDGALHVPQVFVVLVPLISQVGEIRVGTPSRSAGRCGTRSAAVCSLVVFGDTADTTTCLTILRDVRYVVVIGHACIVAAWCAQCLAVVGLRLAPQPFALRLRNLTEVFPFRAAIGRVCGVTITNIVLHDGRTINYDILTCHTIVRITLGRVQGCGAAIAPVDSGFGPQPLVFVKG